MNQPKKHTRYSLANIMVVTAIIIALAMGVLHYGERLYAPSQKTVPVEQAKVVNQPVITMNQVEDTLAASHVNGFTIEEMIIWTNKTGNEVFGISRQGGFFYRVNFK